jgi:transposase
MPKGCFAMQWRDVLGVLFEDESFAGLFTGRGQPAQSPGRLAVISVLQFTEGLTDRQAADAGRVRVDWKYLLGLELDDQGFDASVLSEFRARLAQSEQAETLIFQRVIDLLKQADLIAAGGRHPGACRLPRPCWSEPLVEVGPVLREVAVCGTSGWPARAVRWWSVVLLPLAYLGVSNAFALLRLLLMGDRDKDAEILAFKRFTSTRPICPRKPSRMTRPLRVSPAHRRGWW